MVTTDNNGGGKGVLLSEINGFRKDIDPENLRLIAKPKISEIHFEDKQNLLVFPPDFALIKDKIGDESICSLTDNETKLTTGNIMGFIGVNDTKLSIKSRFAKSDGEDYFLHYMLQKVFSLNLFDMKFGTNSESVFDFLLYLFPYYLRKAMRAGVYKEYITRRYNDANVRGVIDVARHISRNIPFAGKIAYRTREYSFDNSVTQLIRHTIEYIRTHPFGGNILNSDDETRACVSQIETATPSYERNSRRKVINQNIRPIRHPYFLDYVFLQRICLQILRHEQLKYGTEKDEIYGILFDGAWLWEEYLNTILQQRGFIHPENKIGKNGIYLFEKEDKTQWEDENIICTHSRCKRYPDFYRKKKDENGKILDESEMILDAKYKRLESGHIDRDDMHQIISYMHVEKAKSGGLIYPLQNENCMITHIGRLRNSGGEIFIYGFSVPQKCGNYLAFNEEISKSEKALLDRF